MRTPFFIGIFTLTVAIAGGAEWASRQAGDATDNATPGQVEKRPDKGLPGAPSSASESAASPAAPEPSGVEAPPEHVAPMLVLAEDQGGFRLNGVTLSDEGAAKIDQFIASLDPEKVVHFVIEGHTDSLGSDDVNQRVGLARAIAVRQYLANQCEIPFDLMRVKSYGSSQPIADNATQEGRTTNRRVVIRVVE